MSKAQYWKIVKVFACVECPFAKKENRLFGVDVVSGLVCGKENKLISVLPITRDDFPRWCPLESGHKDAVDDDL